MSVGAVVGDIATSIVGTITGLGVGLGSSCWSDSRFGFGVAVGGMLVAVDGTDVGGALVAVGGTDVGGALVAVGGTRVGGSAVGVSANNGAALTDRAVPVVAIRISTIIIISRPHFKISMFIASVPSWTGPGAHLAPHLCIYR
jgi:hypothetical protein